jgi:hypothetical protein
MRPNKTLPAALVCRGIRRLLCRDRQRRESLHRKPHNKDPSIRAGVFVTQTNRALGVSGGWGSARLVVTLDRRLF